MIIIKTDDEYTKLIKDSKNPKVTIQDYDMADHLVIEEVEEEGAKIDEHGYIYFEFEM